MLEGIAKHVSGKVITGLILVGGVLAGIWFWKHPDDLRTLWDVLKGVLVWIAFVMVLPWATFFVPRWVVAKESNLAAGLMLAGYLLLDMVFAVFLMNGVRGHGALTWTVVIVGFLSAAVYNFLACEYQANRLEEI